MELVTANLKGGYRRERWEGRDWYVVSMTSLVPGVLPGSQGPLLYPDEEVARDPAIWNGVPATAGHPVIDGQHVSARSPRVIEKQGVGWVFESVFNGKLDHELWLDVAKARKVDARIVDAIEAGRPLEVSTGLFTTNEPTAGVHNGREYKAVARNYRADHVAILVDAKGACSNRDGCGINVNSRLRAAWLKFGRKFGLVGNATGEVSAAKACEILHDGHANGKKLTDKQRRFFGAKCGKRPTANVGEDGWECSVCDTNHGPAPEPVANSQGGDATTSQEQSMALTQEQRKAHADFIVTNCDCWKGAAMGKVLNDLPEEELLKVRAGVEKAGKALAVANAVERTLGQEVLTVNAADMGMAMMEKCKKLMAEKDKPAMNAVPPALPVAQPVTAEQWFAAAPPEVQSAVRNAVKVERQQKQAVVNRLVANRPQDQREARAAQLMKLDLEELQERLNDLPPVANDNPFAPNWSGAAAPITNAQDDSDNILPLYDLSARAEEPARKQA